MGGIGHWVHNRHSQRYLLLFCLPCYSWCARIGLQTPPHCQAWAERYIWAVAHGQVPLLGQVPSQGSSACPRALSWACLLVIQASGRMVRLQTEPAPWSLGPYLPLFSFDRGPRPTQALRSFGDFALSGIIWHRSLPQSLAVGESALAISEWLWGCMLADLRSPWPTLTCTKTFD